MAEAVKEVRPGQCAACSTDDVPSGYKNGHRNGNGQTHAIDDALPLIEVEETSYV